VPELGFWGPSRLLSDLRDGARRYWRSLVVAGATGCILPFAPALYVPFFGQLPVGKLPLLGILAVLAGIAALPESGMGWGTGASGEALTARALAQLKVEGNVILEDRLIAGTTTKIERLVIGPTGVASVKTETSADRLKANEGDSGGGRRSPTAAHAALREAVAVEEALADQLQPRHLKVRSVLCMVQARPRLSPFGSSRQPVSIVDGRGVVRLIRKPPKRLSAEDVRELARVANDRLRPVTAPLPELYNPLPATVPFDWSTTSDVKPSPLDEEEDLAYMPPNRRAHIQAALEARARATDDRTYWSSGGLTAGKAPPTIPPGELRER
jgi:hypothetical protein